MCDACGDPSQFRLFLCHACWRRAPEEILRLWDWARTRADKCVVAAHLAIWARAYREAAASRG